MTLAEGDEVIQTFSADRTNKKLSVTVLPRRSRPVIPIGIPSSRSSAYRICLGPAEDNEVQCPREMPRVKPANEATLTPIANTWFGTTFAVADDHRTNTSGDPVVFDISTTFFSLTIGMQQTAFLQNQSGGTLHLTYTSLP